MCKTTDPKMALSIVSNSKKELKHKKACQGTGGLAIYLSKPNYVQDSIALIHVLYYNDAVMTPCILELRADPAYSCIFFAHEHLSTPKFDCTDEEPGPAQINQHQLHQK
jgi:hypothetical protein